MHAHRVLVVSSLLVLARCGGSDVVLSAGEPAPAEVASAAATSPLGDAPPSLVARDAAGTLWRYPSNGAGGFGRAVPFGPGWSGMDVVLAAGDLTGDGRDEVLARRASTGELVRYDGTSAGGLVGPTLVGPGWAGYEHVVAPGDVDGDSLPDLLARDPQGLGWLYPGDGRGGFSPRRALLSAFDGHLEVAPAHDLDGDGRVDLLSRDAAGWWWHPGLRGPGFGAPRPLLGLPTDLVSVQGAGDLDGDDRSDLLGVEPGSGRLLLFAGDGRGAVAAPRQVGQGWNGFTLFSVIERGAPSPLPHGRAFFVTTELGDATSGAAWVRLSQLTFDVRGRVRRESWRWSQATFTGDARVNKVVVGETIGCARRCPIRTPAGFERGASPARDEGRFQLRGDELVVRWPSGTTRWRLTGSASLTTTTLTSSAEGATQGRGAGSTAALSRAVSLDTMRRSGVVRGPYWSNAYATPTKALSDSFPFAAYERCTGAEALQNVSVTNRDPLARWASYLFADAARDGRKLTWNHQLGAVTQHEAPGSVCASPLGGHTVAGLQVLDDAGAFRGWVSAEASLHGRFTGGAVVAIEALLTP